MATTNSINHPKIENLIFVEFVLCLQHTWANTKHIHSHEMIFWPFRLNRYHFLFCICLLEGTKVQTIYFLSWLFVYIAILRFDTEKFDLCARYYFRAEIDICIYKAAATIPASNHIKYIFDELPRNHCKRMMMTIILYVRVCYGWIWWLL